MSGPRIALVLGGARSGKSTEAERLVADWADGRPVTYVATALPDNDDPSLAARVAAHRARRPATWATVDAGRDLPGVLRSIEGPVLLDSLGPWVAAAFPDAPEPRAVVDALLDRDGDTVVVSDEVGLAVHPVSASGRWFVDALGSVNQSVSAVATHACLVVAGRVLVLPPASAPDVGAGRSDDAPLDSSVPGPADSAERQHPAPGSDGPDAGVMGTGAGTGAVTRTAAGTPAADAPGSAARAPRTAGST
ncbi:MAG: cobalbumin biosynthesis protein [Acidimicrobiales bacterium]|nr:cobalbumin biosynthesis protein [Acidimicrobiales bacterium]